MRSAFVLVLFYLQMTVEKKMARNAKMVRASTVSAIVTTGSEDAIVKYQVRRINEDQKRRSQVLKK